MKSFNANSEAILTFHFVDGSMISLWWKSDQSNSAGGVWQISTSTVISAGPEWMTMMQPLFDITNSKVLAALNSKYTCTMSENVRLLRSQSSSRLSADILELCSKQNRVVTKYPDERVYLLVAIDTATGAYATAAETDAFAASLGLMRPKAFPAKAVGLKTLESFIDFVEEQSRSPEFPPVCPPPLGRRFPFPEFAMFHSEP